jgi:Lrp/AsnC family transcriptional regulator for asnA, asnC and gidA
VERAKITGIDVGIIRSLHRDARKPLAKIAAELGVPQSTVRHRLNRLVRHGLVEFAAVTNPLRIGYEIWAIIEIQAQPSKIRSVATQLARAAEVYFVGITTGDYDILVNAVFRTNAELLEFLTGRLTRIGGITRTSTSTVLDVVKRALTLDVAEPPADRRSRTRSRSHRS